MAEYAGMYVCDMCGEGHNLYGTSFCKHQDADVHGRMCDCGICRGRRAFAERALEAHAAEMKARIRPFTDRQAWLKDRKAVATRPTRRRRSPRAWFIDWWCSHASPAARGEDLKNLLTTSDQPGTMNP